MSTKNGCMGTDTSIINMRSKRICGGFVLIIYSCICLLSHFPAFHNHDFSVDGSCCQNGTFCAVSHGFIDHDIQTVLSVSQPVHQHGPCMACMWQAMAKTSGTFYVIPFNIKLISRNEPVPLYDAPVCSFFYGTRQSRAPPA